MLMTWTGSAWTCGDWLGDIRFGLRALAKNPGFTALAVAMLALGIGVNATVFTVADAVLFKGFPRSPGTIACYTSATAAAAFPIPIFWISARRRNRFRGWGSPTASGAP